MSTGKSDIGTNRYPTRIGVGGSATDTALLHVQQAIVPARTFERIHFLDYAAKEMKSLIRR